ncbi:MAG: pyruvate kinase [Kosmotoga sp.]|nr:MAG: pyruvate kinase [Kosmotoga sp.]
MRKTKIVCTIGPSTRTKEMLKRMVKEGMNVARLNTSHDDIEGHRKNIRTIKQVRDELRCPIAILVDLAGPKLRTGNFKDDKVKLIKGKEFILTTDLVEGDANKVSVNYKDLPKELDKGTIILVDDGKIKLKVINTDEKNVYTKILIGGSIKSRRGINIPGVDTGISAITRKDREFIKLGVKENVDYFALSFVRKPDDVLMAKKEIEKAGANIPVISKIETAQALKYIDKIAEVSDGLMVARGDLGVEIPVERVPVEQKRIIKQGNHYRIPVITATQMLESMVKNSTPTRAEATDITNAIIDGTDAIMLSAETSIGSYPLEAIKVMHSTSTFTERYLTKNQSLTQWTSTHVITDDHTDAICRAAWDISDNLKIKLIVSSTYSGHTARNVSGFRPSSHILAVTPNEKTYFRLALVWGVIPLHLKLGESIDEMVEKAGKKARELDLLEKDDTFIITAGVPLGVTNTTNILKLEKA